VEEEMSVPLKKLIEDHAGGVIGMRKQHKYHFTIKLIYIADT